MGIDCPYYKKKYYSVKHLIVHLGIRPNTYTWPTCTFPLKPDSIVLTELCDYSHGKLIPGRQSLITRAKEKARQQTQGKRARKLAEALLPDGNIPTKRIKLVPNA